jgi:hypothetical protein
METKQDVEQWMDAQRARWTSNTSVSARLEVFIEIYDTVPTHLHGVAILYDNIQFHRASL